MERSEHRMGARVAAILCAILWCNVVDAIAATDPIEPARVAIRVKQFDRAAKLLQPLVAAGNSDAQFLLGCLYRVGLGVPTRQDEARRLFAAAAASNHAAAAYSLATSLANEDPRDPGQARMWMKRAADAGHALANATLSRGSLPLEFLPQKDLTEAGARRAALWLAVQQNEPQLVMLLADAESIRRTDEFGRGLVSLAAYSGAADVVPVLLRMSARADQADAFGVTPLMLASHRGDITIVKALMQARAPLDRVDRVGNSALMYAAASSHTKVVAQLLDAGAPLTTLNAQGWSALDWAVHANAASAADLLRARGLSTKRTVDMMAGSPAIPLRRASANDLYRGQSDLYVAASRSSPQLLQAVLTHEGDTERDHVLPAAVIFPLVVTGSPATWDAALAAGIDQSSVPPDAWHWLARHGDSAILKKLLAHGEQAALGSGKILLAAIRARRVDSATALLDAGADVNELDDEGRTPLMLAAASGQTDIAGALLRHLSQTNVADKLGRTALWYAAAAGNAQMTDSLIGDAAAVEQADASGATPLLCAAARGHTNVVASLLRVGARVDAKTKNGSSALMLASRGGHTAVIGQLLAAGIGIDVQNRYGETALMVATRAGQAAIVQQLLDAGASEKLRNSDRATALDIANALEFANIQALLQRSQ